MKRASLIARVFSVVCLATFVLAAPAAHAAEKVVRLFIWPGYTTPEMLETFHKRTGIKVIESNYASNEELLAKLQAGATGYDLAVPSDYMVAVMAKLGLLETLDKAKIPNSKNLDPTYLDKPYDPGNKVSLPYAWSLTGIAVNKTVYKKPVTSWADLLANPDAAGKISLLDDVREALGAALKLNGHSLNSTDPAELKQARDTLIAAKKGVKAFNSTPVDLITKGEVGLAQMYGAEALLAGRDSGGKIEFVVPKEGGTLAIDNVVLLKSAQDKESALAFIDYLLSVDTNVDFVKRILAGPVVKDTRAKLPKALADDPNLFPPAEKLAKCEMMQDLGDATAQYDRIWSEVKVASH